MGITKIESYDGKGAYVAGDHLDVFELNGANYLVEDTIRGDGSSNAKILAVYRVISNSTAIQINDERIVCELEKIVSAKRIDQEDEVRSEPHCKDGLEN